MDISLNHKSNVSARCQRARCATLVVLLGIMHFLFMQSSLAVAEPVVAQVTLPEMMLEAIRSAIKTHPEVLKADSEMQSAKSQVKAGEYRWLPTAEVGVRTGESGDRYSTMGINQPLWDGGKRNADFDAVKAGASAAYAGKYLSMQSLGIAATDAYFGLALARERLLVAEANVHEHKKLYASVDKRNIGGVGSKSDASLATSRLQQALAAEKQAQGEVLKAEAIYLAVIGAKPSSEQIQEMTPWDLPGDQDGLLEKAVNRSPSLKKLRDEVKVAEANVASSRAQLFPTMFARVDNTRYFGSGPFDNDTRFSVNMQWQNDVALTQRFRIEAAQHAVAAAQHALASEERVLKQTAANYLADYIAATKRKEELERFSKSAIETVGLFKRQFTIGRRSWPEVMNTLQDLYIAQTQKAEASYAMLISRMRLAFLVGEMDEYINHEIGSVGNSYTLQP